MKVHIRIVLLVSLLAVFVCLGLLSSAQQLPIANVPSATTEDLPLFLDGEPIGSMANTSALESRFRSLQEKLDLSSNSASSFNSASSLDSAASSNSATSSDSAGGEYPNIGRIVFALDDRLPMTQVGQLREKLRDYFGYPAFTRIFLLGGQPCNGNRSRAARSGERFVLSNSQLSIDEVKKIKASENCWLGIYLMMPGPKATYASRLLKSFRTAVSSLEITDTGAYLLNEQVRDPKLRASPIANLENPSLRRRVDAATVTHRQIEASLLEKEVDSWIKLRSAEGPIDYLEGDDKTVQLPIIAAGPASYGALAQVLKFVGKQKVKLMILVNEPAPLGSAKSK